MKLLYTADGLIVSRSIRFAFGSNSSYVFELEKEADILVDCVSSSGLVGISEELWYGGEKRTKDGEK